MQRTMRPDTVDYHSQHRSPNMTPMTPMTHANGAGARNVYGDGSWQLTIFVTDLQVERSLRVRGDLHIGGVMIKLVDSLGRVFSYIKIIKLRIGFQIPTQISYSI